MFILTIAVLVFSHVTRALQKAAKRSGCFEQWRVF
jgi:hypothetical protein